MTPQPDQPTKGSTMPDKHVVNLITEIQMLLRDRITYRRLWPLEEYGIKYDTKKSSWYDDEGRHLSHYSIVRIVGCTSAELTEWESDAIQQYQHS